MAKTNLMGAIEVAGTTFLTNVKPDPYDLRDLDYRPMLRALPPRLHAEPRRLAFRVLTQVGQSCTGHAVAAVVNTVLSHQADDLGLPPAKPVSPYMLYRLARRYDEFGGEDDIGSSLRGAFKGWLRHGVALHDEWTALARRQRRRPLDADVDLDEPDFVASCRVRPLGAYYRVNPFRLDDMQSAINELHAIAVSAAIHTGWAEPEPLERPDGSPAWVIKRTARPTPAGGHAFAIVGYDELGFLVQNSWGRKWGGGGFAILTYEDWLKSAYDAWVARPGVPNTPFVSPASASRVTTAGDVVSFGGPNLSLLRDYVVNTANDGRLSEHGRATSSVGQIEGIFRTMTAKHDAWCLEDRNRTRHVVLYAHGGLVDETNGLGTAQQQLNWWLNNHVYPISFVWQSGALDTVMGALADLLGVQEPVGGIQFDREEQWDRRVERVSRFLFSGLWGEMKENGRGTSAAGSLRDPRGATLVARHLRAYSDRHGAANVRIHLVGHSAGTIVLAAILDRLVLEGLRVDSLALMGGALRADDFAAGSSRPYPVRSVLGHLHSGALRRLTTFNLSEQMEQDDKCPGGDMTFYYKSLLYLVARGLEKQPDPATGIVPLVGLERGLDMPVRGAPETLRVALAALPDAEIVIAPGGTASDLRSDARGHADFDNDRATMTSVLLRALNVERAARGRKPLREPIGGPYEPNAPIRFSAAGTTARELPGGGAHEGGMSAAPSSPVVPGRPGAADVEPADLEAAGGLEVAAEIEPEAVDGAGAGALPVGSEAVAEAAGEAVPKGAEITAIEGPEGPILVAAALPPARPETPPSPIQVPREAAIAPTSDSPTFDVLYANGWKRRAVR